MTTLFMDGFDHYGQGDTGRLNMLSGPWASVANGSFSGGANGPQVPSWGTRTGEFALSNNNFTGVYRRVLPSTATALIVGCGFSVPSLPAASGRNAIVTFLDGSGTLIAELWLDTTGALSLRNNSGILAATSGPVIVGANWHFLEMKLDITAGTFTLRVDDTSGSGTPALAVTGLTLVGPIAQLWVLRVGVASDGFVTAWMDDLVVRDTAGSVNNGFEGDLRVAALYPRADDLTHQGWTPRYRQKFGDGILDNRAQNASCVTAASSTSTNLGAADFTIEGFHRFFALPTGANRAQILGKWDETNNQRSYQLYLGGPSLDSGDLVFRTSTDGHAGTVVEKIAWPWVPELNVWHHVAVVRSSGELLLFLDGVQYGLPIADTDTYFAGTATTAIGAQCDGPSFPVANTGFDGFMDELRLTVGYARYTAAFTPTGPFPRNVGGDPQFADVALLCGFDSGIADESSFSRALTARNGSVQLTPDDGPLVGAFSAFNQHSPRDDTFIEAPLTAATGTLTLNAQPADGDTVTVGTKDGTAAAHYRFKTALATAFDVLIDTSLVLTLQNLFNAVNAGAGAGTKYGTSTTANFDVSASQLPGDEMLATALTPGTAGNSIATSVSLTNGGSWTGTHLAGGADIPGASDFFVDRPPPNTTLINAVQIVQRSYKSDAGSCTVKSSFVGPLGTVVAGAAHALSVSPIYYQDVFETDPDTGNAITPTTLVGGRVRFTRTA